MKKEVWILLLFAAFALVGCRDRNADPEKSKTYSQVAIVYQAGNYPGSNDLSYYLSHNTDSLLVGYIPPKKSDKALLIVSHLSSSYAGGAVTPFLIRLYKSSKSKVVFDTVRTFESLDVITTADAMGEILGYVRKTFPSDHYGMVFSSHGSGWLPPGYYDNPSKYDSEWKNREESFWLCAPHPSLSSWNPYPDGFDGPFVPEGPRVRSVGIESHTVEGAKIVEEFSLPDFAAAVPFHLDYIIFDACLMGGVETAWEIRGVCDKVIFSQAEIMADGMCYSKMMSRLLCEGDVDLEPIVGDYYNLYCNQSGANRSATISLVDCTKLDTLASVCGRLFETYRDSISSVDYSLVQRFFRYNRYFFYDLEDILVKSGISSQDQKALEDALDECVLSKAATDRVLWGYDGFEVKSFCGLSMYLPSHGTTFLNNYYKTLGWNKASGLVK